MTWLYTRPIRPRFLWLRLRIYFLKTFMWLQTRAKNKSTIKLRKAKAPVLLCQWPWSSAIQYKKDIFWLHKKWPGKKLSLGLGKFIRMIQRHLQSCNNGFRICKQQTGAGASSLALRWGQTRDCQRAQLKATWKISLDSNIWKLGIQVI